MRGLLSLLGCLAEPLINEANFIRRILPPARASFLKDIRALTTPSVRRLFRLAFYASSALVGVLSLAPSTTLPPVSINDKIEHVVAYALLGILGAVSFECGALRTILGLAAYGLLLELLQAFSPGRSPELADALADIVGACVGYGTLITLRRARAGRLAARAIYRRAPNAGEGNHMASGSSTADSPLSD